MFHDTYVRGTCGPPVADEQVADLATLLAAGPVEILLTGRGAVVPAGMAGQMGNGEGVRASPRRSGRIGDPLSATVATATRTDLPSVVSGGQVAQMQGEQTAGGTPTPHESTAGKMPVPHESTAGKMPAPLKSPAWVCVGTGRQAAVALARRNVRSVLARSAAVSEVAAALRLALTAPPQDAEDALEDAQVDFNLRYSLFATADATLGIENRNLVITDGGDATVHIPRQHLRAAGETYFCKPALDRLMGLDIAEVRFAPTAVLPVWMQLEPGAVMEPDTAHRHRHKGNRPRVRKADFVKDYCVACGRCFIHCPDNAIIHARYDEAAQDTTGVLGIDSDRCTGCGLCSAVCPTNGHGYKAIVMIEADAEGTPEMHCVG